jgi:hypothetical protein
MKLESTKKEIVKFLSSSSFHGLQYFVGDYSLVEKIGWMFITYIMTCYGIIWLDTATQDWSRNPMKFVKQTSGLPLSEVQFPTVTICADFNPDRWGLMRNLLNLIEFECLNEEDCQRVRKMMELQNIVR